MIHEGKGGGGGELTGGQRLVYVCVQGGIGIVGIATAIERRGVFFFFFRGVV